MGVGAGATVRRRRHLDVPGLTGRVRFRVRTRVPFARIAVASITLGGGAVAGARSSASPWRDVFEALASPGELLWWSTAGGVFAGRPAGVMGTAVWVLGTAAFWFVVGVLLTAAAARLSRRRRG